MLIKYIWNNVCSCGWYVYCLAFGFCVFHSAFNSLIYDILSSSLNHHLEHSFYYGVKTLFTVNNESFFNELYMNATTFIKNPNQPRRQSNGNRSLKLGVYLVFIHILTYKEILRDTQRKRL